MSADDSVSRWLVNLKAGDPEAANQLWGRYFQRLAGLARKRLEGIPRLAKDGEDVALSAFHSLCEGVEKGQFANLSDRDSLWKLLVTITARKAKQTIRDEFRQKRGGGDVLGESGLFTPGQDRDAPFGMEIFPSQEPSPEFAAEVAEEWQRLLGKLPDDELRNIAVWKMEGATSEEVASRLGKALATVERRLKLIRSLWADEGPA